ncbi:Bacterial type II/III secretion system short domain protein [Phycisphaerae bacterium RAS2]|nr:Bacterial type II/III secretion system short domain protein [Phycisphaerae bacterium RAS2]
MSSYFLALAIALSTSVPLIAQSQTSEPTQARDATNAAQTDPVVVNVANGNSHALARMLGEVFPGLLISALDDSPVLILRGMDQEVSQARALVEKVLQQNSRTGEAEIKVIPLKLSSAPNLSNQLRVVFAQSPVTIVPDASQNALVVRGPIGILDAVEAIIQQLDVAPPSAPAQNISLEFSFLTAGPDKPDAGLPLPDDLAEIGRELNRFGTIKLMGRLKTIATPNQRFEMEGMIAEKFNIRIKGRVNSCDASGAIAEIEAAAVHFRSVPADPSKLAQPPVGPIQSGVYNLQTTLKLTPNQDLAVGIAPAGAHVGSSLVLVVRASW